MKTVPPRALERPSFPSHAGAWDGVCITILLLLSVATALSQMNPLPDKILIHKAARTMSLMHGDSVIKTYKVCLGSEPVEPKRQEGDGRTPEGKYTISRHNPNSRYHLALKISYPNEHDIKQAKARNVSPGGDIMIHGLPNNYIPATPRILLGDWTLGCIAVTNEEIEEIYANVKNGTEVEILP